MLDISLIRNDPARVQRALKKRGVRVDLNEFLALDKEFRQVQTTVEGVRADRRKLSEEAARLRREGGDFTSQRDRSQALSERLAHLEARRSELESARADFLDPLPNLPDDDVLPGGKENNEVLRTFGDKPHVGFDIKDHTQLAEDLHLIDYHRGTKLSGNGFWIYRGEGAMLEWALINYFIDAHRRAGDEFILPPHILGHEAGYAAGQFPKFAEDVYTVDAGQDGPQQFMLPTSETALLNLHRDETFAAADLPKKYFAFSPCYRKEIGGYRATERGTLRGHQFHKVEMFQFTRPQESERAQAGILARAERLVADLGLHYRVTHLAAEDLSAAMATTCDVEVWMPSINAYVEVSSVSNARDYQARRAKIRYRPTQGKPTFVHTLNGSGLATSRLLPAILEQFQQADGTVAVPEVLRKWGLSRALTPDR